MPRLAVLLNRFCGQTATAPISDRGNDRERRARWTGYSSLGAQGLAVATNLISVPLTVGYLGPERYGVWLTLSSLLSWLYLFDLGLGGNALVNTLAEAHGNDDRRLAREMVATAFWSLVGMALIMILAFALAFPWVSWSSVFNASEAVPAAELRWAVILSVAGFSLMFPASVVNAIYRGYQEGYIGNLWGVAASLFSLLALIAVTRYQGGLPQLVIALTGVRILVLFINAGYLFLRQHPWLMPNPRCCARHSFKRLMSLGYKYLIVQFAAIGMFQSQPMIISQYLGPGQVGIFNITYRLVTLPLMLVQMFNFPLTPAYGEAWARGDWSWIRRTLRRYLLNSTVVSLILTGPLLFLAGPIITWWVGAAFIPSHALTLGMAAYCVVNCILTPMSVILYGLERVGGQSIIATANALVTIAAGLLLTKIYGLSGMALAMVLGMLFANAAGQAFEIKKVFSYAG